MVVNSNPWIIIRNVRKKNFANDMFISYISLSFKLKDNSRVFCTYWFKRANSS